MSAANKAIVRRLFDEVWNSRKLAVIEEIIAPEHTYTDPALPHLPPGPEGMRQLSEALHQAFPDGHWAIDDMIAEEDQVVTRWTGSGTQTNDLWGLPPTGKRVTVSGVYVQRIGGSQILESRNTWDTLGMLQQLGMSSDQFG